MTSSNVVAMIDKRQFFSHAIPDALLIALSELLPSQQNADKQMNVDSISQMEARLIAIKNSWADYIDPYFALFKFYFRTANYHKAEIIVWQAAKLLSKRQGFSVNYRRLRRESMDWLANDSDQRHFLFCLKAMGVIRLRRGRIFLAKKVLSKLSELDPCDEIGGGNFLAIAESF